MIPLLHSTMLDYLTIILYYKILPHANVIDPILVSFNEIFVAPLGFPPLVEFTYVGAESTTNHRKLKTKNPQELG